MLNQLEGKNPVLECLRRGRRDIKHVWVDLGARDERRLSEILQRCATLNIPVARVPRQELDRRAEGRVHNGIVARVEPVKTWKMGALLRECASEYPFFMLADELSYEHNLGAILRSGLGFGLDGLIVPTKRGAQLSPVAQRVSMGGVESVPVVREGLYSAMKLIKKAGIPIVGADMAGKPAHEVDLKGPLAIVMGGEGRGLPDGLTTRCDQLISVPLMNNLESLNVSVAAALLMYEKRRQDGFPVNSATQCG